jgi:hypothetical protein
MFVLLFDRTVRYPNEPNTTALPDELSSCTIDFSSMSRRCDVRIRSSVEAISNCRYSQRTYVTHRRTQPHS